MIDLQGFSYTGLHTITNCSVRNILFKNKTPTLLIAGPRDKQFVPFREFAEKTMPKLEVLTLDGGHAVNIDAAEQFNQAVRDFVSRFIVIK